MDHMLEAIYGLHGADPKTLESVSAAFDQFNKVGTEIETRRNKQHRKRGYMGKEHTNL